MFVAALERWPQSGVPDSPGAWLMAAARHRAVDLLRHRAMQERRLVAVATEDDRRARPDTAAEAIAAAEGIADDMLGLIFTACHPILAPDARVALTLRMVGGLSTAEIARAQLATESAVAQRIVRAKRTLQTAAVSFEVPAGSELTERLGSVLEVVLLIFNEGYAATAGGAWMRPALCEDALRLGRMLAALLPREPEAHGLIALMELQASRIAARHGPDGAPVLLADQDRRRWDRLLIRRGLAAAERGRALASAAGAVGPYVLQAEIAAAHATAASVEETDWPRIAALYGALAERSGSPIVELNRAVAVGMADGPAAGLAITDRLTHLSLLAGYHLLPAVRADFLVRLGRSAEARTELQRAAALATNDRERALLTARAAALDGGPLARGG